jgi:hypothetical protein
VPKSSYPLITNVAEPELEPQELHRLGGAGARAVTQRAPVSTAQNVMNKMYSFFFKWHKLNIFLLVFPTFFIKPNQKKKYCQTLSELLSL